MQVCRLLVQDFAAKKESCAVSQPLALDAPGKPGAVIHRRD